MSETPSCNLEIRIKSRELQFHLHIKNYLKLNTFNILLYSEFNEFIISCIVLFITYVSWMSICLMILMFSSNCSILNLSAMATDVLKRFTVPCTETCLFHLHHVQWQSGLVALVGLFHLFHQLLWTTHLLWTVEAYHLYPSLELMLSQFLETIPNHKSLIWILHKQWYI